MPEEKDMSERESHIEKFKVGSSQEDIKKFQAPSWQKEMPDIRMQAGDDKEFFSGMEAREASEMERSRLLQITDFEQSILRESNHPPAIRWALREFLEKVENITIVSPPLENKWGEVNIYGLLRSRESALKTGADRPLVEYLELERDGVYAHRFKTVEIPDDILEIKDRSERRREIRKYLEKPEELGLEEIENRQLLIKEVERGIRETEARTKIDDLYGTYLRIKGSLQDFYRIPFAPENYLPVSEDFETVCKLPATAGIEDEEWSKKGWVLQTEREKEKERLEGHFGKRIDLGVRLYLISAISERREEMEELMKAPGYQKIIMPVLREALSKNKDNKRIKKIIEKHGEDPERIFIGDVSSWRTRGERDEKEEAEHEALRRTNRGLLTAQGNIFARKERRSQKLTLDETIALILGGDKAAQEMARRIFYLAGTAAYYGSERDETKYRDGKIISAEVDREGDPYADAREKASDILAYYLYKLGYSEWGGPEELCGETPQRLVTDLFRFSAIPNPIYFEEELDLNEDKEEQIEEIEWQKLISTRSMYELMWWGWDGENPLTLGEIDWESFNNYFWKDHTIRLHFAGNEGMLFDVLTGNEKVWDARNFQSVRWWKEYGMALRICLGNWVFTEGKNKEWFDKNMPKIERLARILKGQAGSGEERALDEIEKRALEKLRQGFKDREKRPKTDEGYKLKAAKQLLGEQRQEVIYKTNDALVKAIKSFWPKYEVSPRHGLGATSAMKANIDDARKAAGVFISEKEKNDYLREKR